MNKKYIESVMKENLGKYVGMPITKDTLERIKLEIEKWKLTVSNVNHGFYIVPRIKISNENLDTHSFNEIYVEAGGASFSLGRMMCSECEMIGEKENGAIYVEEDLNCNEYVMRQVIE